MTYMIPFLREKGYRVSAYGITMDTQECRWAAEKATMAETAADAIAHATAVIGGIPFRPEEAGYVEHLRMGQSLYTAGIPNRSRQELEQKGIKVYDLMESESVRMENSAATAEGVVLEVLQRAELLLYDYEVLVFGYGRCGKLIVERMKGLCGKVSVVSRNPVEKAIVHTQGMEVYDLQRWQNGEYRIAKNQIWINTMPIGHLYPYLKKDRNGKKLEERPACMLDIAGTLEDSDYVYLKGLPGKYRPKAMAKVYVEEMIRK